MIQRIGKCRIMPPKIPPPTRRFKNPVINGIAVYVLYSKMVATGAAPSDVCRHIRGGDVTLHMTMMQELHLTFAMFRSMDEGKRAGRDLFRLQDAIIADMMAGGDGTRWYTNLVLPDSFFAFLDAIGYVLIQPAA
jgi:hypothetical protein